MKKNKFQAPELLLPAGNMQKLKIGLEYGGDAFYLGFTPFSLRCNDNGFNKNDLLEGREMIKSAGKKCYLTMNIYPKSEKIEPLKKQIEFVRKEVKPDAIIVADAGVVEMLKEYYPEVEIHMSVQANIMNHRAVEFWKKQGATRIILPRELSLKDISAIKKNVHDVELEFFVHGAICVAYSGRCLLSNYMSGRDSNQGACAHSCRWKYKVLKEDEKEAREKQLEEETYYIEEEKRPGEFYGIKEDEHGTYFMNSKDNCMLPYLKELTEAGICSFKVEGRNKSEYYLATVAKAYRQGIDDMMGGKDFDKNLLKEVEKTANRKFIPGFLFGFKVETKDVYYESNAPLQTHKFVGMVLGKAKLKQKKEDLYEVTIKNRLDKGEEVEIMTPNNQFILKVEELFDLEGNQLESVHGGAGNKILKLKKGIEYGAMLRKRFLTPALRK